MGGPTSVTSPPIFDMAKVSERATRECRTSPTMAMRSPPNEGKCSRMVNRSRRAWVGCSWVPSPAFRTLAPTHRDSVWGAPEDECLMTMASAPIASSVSAVSFRLSPFDTLDPLVEKLMTSADSRFAASSKEIRVRVEFS